MSDTHVDNGAEYDASKITVLEGLEAVRVRPAMYIGDTGERGLHHLVNEVVDNSIDEALAGYASKINVFIHPDNSISVEDDGRGIPIDMHEGEGKPAVEVVLTMLHAGGKFGQGSYKVSGGLHGVGVACVNALSDWLVTEVYRNGKIYTISFERGMTVSPLKEIGTTVKRGTKVTFKPDGTIFSDTIYKWGILCKRLRELAFLNNGIFISLTDERTGEHEDFHYAGGIREFVALLNKEKTKIGDVIYFHRERNGIDVEVAMQYTDGSSEEIHSYANNINTIEGGTHLTGFQAALTRTMNTYVKATMKFDKQLTGADVREGLAAIVSVKVPDPQFEGQTKTKLGNSDVRGIVESVINEELAIYLEEHPDIAKSIASQTVRAAQGREAAAKARKAFLENNTVASFGLPGKLVDCSSRDPEERELYIVEGDSAGGTVKNGRDSKYQALLPLRGKIINVEKVPEYRVLDNKEIQSLIYAIGCGYGKDFDVSKARYHRVIIMTDADVDGAHIRTLLLTFFFRQMKPLIESGFVYIAKPPLYKVSKNKKERYLYTDDQLNNYLLELGMGDVVATDAAGNEVTAEQLREIINLFNRASSIDLSLRRAGFNSLEYFSKIRDDGSCPFAYISVRRPDGEILNHYVYNIEEQNEFVEKWSGVLREAMSQLPPPENDAEAKEREEELRKRIQVFSIFEHGECTEFINELKEKNLPFKQLFTPGELMFTIGAGKTKQEAHSFADVFSIIRNSGKEGSGLRVQRYKGLGEMNAKQLWETTMDPLTRTMIKVKIEDAIEADRIFNLLMGDVVEPRREYIEQNAANVKDLDI